MDARVPQAAAALRRGELIAFPTETVYGLGADAANESAVRAIFALKGRPADHPVIVHLLDASRMDAWAAAPPASALKLAQAFWPGPLTLILRKAANVSPLVTGGQDTVGLRCPAHPIARELLRQFAKIGSGAIAAPSANRFGHVSPTTAQHVRDEFGPALTVLDGGACEVGIESTILDLSREVPVLLRPGAVSRDQIAAVIGQMPQDRDAAAPRASGTLAAHYAPRTPLELVDKQHLESMVKAAFAKGRRVAVLAPRPARVSVATIWREASETPAAYAHDLYANLRALDASGADLIVVEAPPAHPAWEAVNDRLARAAAGADDDET